MASSARTPARASGRARSKPDADDASDPTIAGVPLSSLVEMKDTRAGPRSKRGLIIKVAVTHFGGVGYETTKWAQIADDVGIGQTALYYYFESKAHCLLTIMRLQLATSLQRFIAVTAERDAPEEALREALKAAFDVAPQEVSQLRVLMANGEILANPRSSEREEAERQKCLALTHRIEESWTELIRRVLAQRQGDRRDPKLLALLVLGLLNSVWRWFRADGAVTVAEVAKLGVDSALRVVG